MVELGLSPVRPADRALSEADASDNVAGLQSKAGHIAFITPIRRIRVTKSAPSPIPYKRLSAEILDLMEPTEWR